MRAERSQESTAAAAAEQAALQRTHAAGGLCAEGCCGIFVWFGYLGDAGLIE